MTHLNAFLEQIKSKSDRLVHVFLLAFYLGGFLLANYYDTWEIAFGVGTLSLAAFYSTRLLLRDSVAYQYVLGVVIGVFMAQYIYQMHGMFEMHFVAFLGSAILITYQNWKLQIPLALFVLVHHGLFGYLQYAGFEDVYFTQLDYMDLHTFAIHGCLATAIFFICGLWAHHFKKYSERHIEQTFEMGRLQEERLQKETLLALSEDLKMTNVMLNEAQELARIGSWTWDLRTNYVERSAEFYNILQRSKEELASTPEGYAKFLMKEDRRRVNQIVRERVAEGKPFSYEARAIMPDQSIKTIFAKGRTITNERGESVAVHGTVQDITERKAHEQALVDSYEELRKSNHELDKFVYSVSHDLRAPLLSMKGVVDITLLETEEPLTRLHMDMLTGSIDRLDSFIGEILDYSRNARGVVNCEQLAFAGIAAEVTSDLQFMLASAQKPVKIVTNVHQPANFFSDAGRIRIILNNLVSNAIRYHNPAAETPEVTLSILVDPTRAVIQVTDNGIGIADEHQARIFDMFFRVSEKSNGSGLGLYIVKETVEKLSGIIAVHSKIGQGTTFRITLPNLTSHTTSTTDELT